MHGRSFFHFAIDEVQVEKSFVHVLLYRLCDHTGYLNRWYTLHFKNGDANRERGWQKEADRPIARMLGSARSRGEAASLSSPITVALV
jgi:hypothetical protein